MVPSGALHVAARATSASVGQLRGGNDSSLRLRSWRLTGLLSRTRLLTIFRALPGDNTYGPGWYVIKAGVADPPFNSLARAMLRREAAVSSAVTHPRLSTILGWHERRNLAYLALPYLEGLSLRRLLEALRPQRLPINTALCITRQIAEALVALHAAGWLHGQVRPEHIMISPRGHATLIDLTLARRLETAECRVDAAPVPSTICLAPEATLDHSQLTAAADVYSLGLVLYETLAGQKPFDATDPRQLARLHRHTAPRDVRKLRPAVSREVGELVRRMLFKEPVRRPTSTDVVRWLVDLEIEELAT